MNVLKFVHHVGHWLKSEQFNTEFNQVLEQFKQVLEQFKNACADEGIQD